MKKIFLLLIICVISTSVFCQDVFIECPKCLKFHSVTEHFEPDKYPDWPEIPDYPRPRLPHPEFPEEPEWEDPSKPCSPPIFPPSWPPYWPCFE